MGINLREEDTKEMSISELVFNDCYVKDRQAMYRNYDIDISARDFIRGIYKAKNRAMPSEFWNDDNSFDEIMYDNLQYDHTEFDGLMAILYQQLWSKAEMREVLLKVSKGQDIKTLI